MARALTFEVWDGYLDERLGTITVSGNRVVALDPPNDPTLEVFQSDAAEYGAAQTMGTGAWRRHQFVCLTPFCDVYDTYQERTVGTIMADGRLVAEPAELEDDELRALQEELQAHGLREAVRLRQLNTYLMLREPGRDTPVAEGSSSSDSPRPECEP